MHNVNSKLCIACQQPISFLIKPQWIMIVRCVRFVESLRQAHVLSKSLRDTIAYHLYSNNNASPKQQQVVVGVSLYSVLEDETS